MKRSLLVLATVAAVALSAVPAHAQSPFGQPPFGEAPFGQSPFGGGQPGAPMTLQVDVELSDTRDNDYVGIDGYDQGNDPERYYGTLALAVRDALRLSPQSAKVPESWEVIDDGALSAYQSVIQVDGHVGTRQGSDRRVEIDGAAIQRVARTWGFSSAEVNVCPAVDRYDDASAPEMGRSDSNTGCRQWVIDSRAGQAQSPLRVSLTEKPEQSVYWTMNIWMAAISVAVTVVLLVIALFTRKKMFRNLNGSTLGMITGLLIAGLTAWMTAVIVMAVDSGPISELALARNLGDGGKFVAIVVPALLPSLPFVALCLVLAAAKPPSVTPASPSAARPAAHRDVPSWIDVGRPATANERSTESTSPEPAAHEPATEAQQPEEPKQDTPPGSGWSPPA